MNDESDPNTQFDADGYYGEEDVSNEDIDLSLLDEDQKDDK